MAHLHALKPSPKTSNVAILRRLEDFTGPETDCSGKLAPGYGRRAPETLRYPVGFRLKERIINNQLINLQPLQESRITRQWQQSSAKLLKEAILRAVTDCCKTFGLFARRLRASFARISDGRQAYGSTLSDYKCKVPSIAWNLSASPMPHFLKSQTPLLVPPRPEATS